MLKIASFLVILQKVGPRKFLFIVLNEKHFYFPPTFIFISYMIIDLISLFNCVAVRPDEELLDPAEINLLASRCGYLVHPDACTRDVERFLKARVSNLNTTFYKSWKDVASLQEAEMRVLQLLHYISTYGTDYKGKAFTMNDFPAEMRFTEFKIIMPCTECELFDRILGMIYSGVALGGDTLNLILEQALVYNKEYGWEIDVAKIKNREARAMYFLAQNIFPYDPFDLIRVVMYVATGRAMIINDIRTFQGMKEHIAELGILFTNFDTRHFEALATVFYRFKKIFLKLRYICVRKCDKNENLRNLILYINRLRHAANKLKKPFKPAVLQNILDESHTFDDVKNAVESEKSPFILVRLLNYLNVVEQKPETRIFKVRNGKAFITKKPWRENLDLQKISLMRDAIYSRLRAILQPVLKKENGEYVTVRFPEDLEIAAPVSEKQFVGSIPYGSRFRLRTNNYIGIYWRNEWGTRDFDLWMAQPDGSRIGWSASHKRDNILFSGDMTDANPEATEILYCRGQWPDCRINVLRYNGRAGSRFRLFFGADDLSELPRNYMVNPDSIRLNEDLISDLQDTMVGLINCNCVYFGSFSLSSQRVPNNYGNDLINVQKAFAEYLRSFTPLRDILLKLGVKEYDVSEGIDPDIDLTQNLSKDTLMSLFYPVTED